MPALYGSVATCRGLSAAVLHVKLTGMSRARSICVILDSFGGFVCAGHRDWQGPHPELVGACRRPLQQHRVELRDQVRAQVDECDIWVWWHTSCVRETLTM